MSIKKAGYSAIALKADKGTLKTTGALTAGTTYLTGWYKIKKFATVGSALPTLPIGGVFQAPESVTVTLVSGDEVYPLTLTEICKVDLEMSAEMGTIDTTDSCDYPYNTSLADGFSTISGSINTMMRFDEETDEIVPATIDWLNRFFDIVQDDGAGTYTLTEKNDEDILMMILLNSKASGVDGKVENWLITPAILTSTTMNVALKDAFKADYAWTKGDGPASIYMRTIPTASA